MTKVTRYWPFGPHGTIGNNLQGIGDFWRDLNARGIPCYYKGADGYGPIFELMKIGDEYGVENVAVFRLADKNGLNYDVPNWFASSAREAAEQHCRMTIENLPPEFSQRVWLELINEPDKDEDDRLGWTPAEFASWLGDFMTECALIMLPLGYKILGFGFSAGEPEVPDWETKGMLRYLQTCQIHPETLGIALHEYSYVENSLELATNPFPWQIGRFTKLFAACDRHGIRRPKVAITEFGWTLWKVPSPDVAMQQLEWAANSVYGAYPEIIFAAIWNFGEGWKDIRNLAVKLLRPMADRAKTWRMEIEVGDSPLPPDPEVEGTDEERWWQLSLNEQIDHGLQLAPTAIQDAIRRDGFHPVTKEMYVNGEPPLMAAEDWNRRLLPRRVYVWKDGAVRWFNQPTDIPEPPPPEPPPVLPPPPPSGNAIDLRPYFYPENDFGPLYEIQDPDGAQRRVQHQTYGRNLWITKGTGGLQGKSEFEYLYEDGTYIYRGLDTSPGHGRFYVQYEAGLQIAKWVKRYMKVGETFVGPGHYVQFFLKSDCSKSAPNSGGATNICTLFSRGSHEVNGIWFEDVVHLGKADGEQFWFARGIGMIGWRSGWNESWVSELHSPGSRPNNEKEPVCSFTL